MTTIMCWNLNHAGKRSPEPAWTYLREHADVAMVQEAVVPADVDVVTRRGGIEGRDGKRRPWGSAVATFGTQVTIEPVTSAEAFWRGKPQTPAPLDSVDRGHVAIARAHLPEGDVTIVSAYGLIEFGFASGTMLRTLADLEPLLEDPSLGDNVLLGGDWNIGTWWSGKDRKFGEREAAYLSMLKTYGFTDLVDAHLPGDRGRLEGCPCELAECRHVGTHRRAGKTTLYQDDYLYGRGKIVNSVRSATVATDWDWTLSDHAPITCVLSEPAATGTGRDG